MSEGSLKTSVFVILLVVAGMPAHGELDAAIASEAAKIEAQVIAWRRDIHEHPELSNREFRTAKLVAEHLTKLGFEVRTEVGGTGVVGVLKGGLPGGVVALRAEMDALPVIEKTGLAYASKETGVYEGNAVGVMHACGHDNHIAILMGAAQVLASLREAVPGTVKLIFQPAEEGAPKGEEGGADLILIETIFDTLNAKAASFGVEEAFEQAGRTLPVMISGTITDASGRTLSGQTTEAFYNSIRHIKPISIGLNCALGPDLLRQYVEELSRVCETFTSVHPNAGLPNEFGEYDLEAPEMAAEIIDWGKSGFINIVGGCCGTTPAHIRAFAKGLAGVKPRQLPELEVRMRLSGLEACNLN